MSESTTLKPGCLIFCCTASMLIAIVFLAGDISFLLLNTCTVTPREDVGIYFKSLYLQYLAGDDCKYSDTEMTIRREWYICNSDGKLEVVFEKPGGNRLTDHNRVPFWIYTHLVLFTLLAVASLTKIFSSCKGLAEQSAMGWSTMYWIHISVLCLVFNVVSTIIFGLDISLPVKALSDCTLDMWLGSYLLSTVIMTLHFSSGFFFFLLMLVDVIFLAVKFSSGGQEKKGSPWKKQFPSFRSHDVLNQLEDRFQAQDRIEMKGDEEARKRYIETMGFEMVDSRQSAECHKNEGFVMDHSYDPPVKPFLRKYSLHTKIPNFSADHPMQESGESLSRNESNRSRGNSKYGRPLSIPSIPVEDYPMAKSKARQFSDSSKSMGHEYSSKSKLIRTSSGRYMGALEYLQSPPREEAKA